MDAKSVDSEIAAFREMQEELQKMKQDSQILHGQMNENEMVKQELDILEKEDPNGNIFKMVGPVLVKLNSLEDAKQTVSERLEFIKGEIKKLESKIQSTEQKSRDAAVKIQKMQEELQKSTQDAVRAIAAQQQSQQKA